MSEGLSSRRVAYAILNDVFFQKKSLDEAYARQDDFEKLEPRDRAFVKLLASIVLKRAQEMDAVLQQLLTEPLDALKPAQLINVFRLGMAQFAFLETPVHAVVDTSVELAAAEGIAHHKPLVNAVMRRLTREGYPHMEPRDAGRRATPEWLWNQWVADYGVEAALDIAAANLGEAAVDFTLRHPPSAPQWAQMLEATVLPTGSLRKASGGFIPSLQGFDNGDWWVQNAAAALPAVLMGDVAGKTVVDLCAAPGGKTAQLAAAGALVTALDRSAPRMQRLRENMERLKMEVETVVADGAVWQPPAPVDAVLLDAPCTATGTLRHQPDVLFLKDMRDQEKLVALQRRLMANAANMLKPGGLLVYCTCSLQKEESEYQTDWLLAQNAGLRHLPVEAPELGELLTPRGEIRALPQHWAQLGGIDGFYVSLFIKE